MGTGLVVYENNQQIEISTDDLRKYVAPGLDEKEFWMFVQTAKTYGLNPIKREIYAVKYGNTFSVITGYQVYLQRILNADILEYWEVDIEKSDPKNIDSWVGVFKAKRKDWIKEFVWKVPMKEVNKKQALWNIQPEFQLKKVTISQGCRMVAPEIVGGMPYISDELGIDEQNQYEQKATTQPEKTKEPNGDDKQKAIVDITNKINGFLTINEVDEWVKKSEKKLATSKLRLEIESMIKQKRFDLIVDMLAKITNQDIQIVAGFVSIADEAHKTAINEAVKGDPDAIKEVGQYLANYKADVDKLADRQSGKEESGDLGHSGRNDDEDAELDIIFGEKTQEHNPPM